MSNENNNNVRPDLEQDKQEEQKDTGVADEIAKKLEENEQESEDTSNSVQTTDTKPFDITQLTPEQISQLRDMIERTPRGLQTEDYSLIVRLRQLDGKVVVAWQNAYKKQVSDEVEQRAVLKDFIKVKFHGSDDFVEVPYKDFMDEQNRVECKVLSVDTKPIQEKVGVTEKRNEMGVGTELVEMIVTREKSVFKVELPNGDVAEIDGEFVN